MGEIDGMVESRCSNVTSGNASRVAIPALYALTEYKVAHQTTELPLMQVGNSQLQ